MRSPMTRQERFFLKILRTLHQAGALKELILIGSWCQYFYRIYFDNSPEIPAVRTLDLDFLVPHPGKVVRDVDIGSLLTGIGFEPQIDYPSGLQRFQHPELLVEFLVPSRGRGADSPYEVKKLHVNAQSLRFLNLLSEHTITVKSGGIAVRIPEPAAYVLHKFIVGRRRDKEEKSRRDFSAAKEIGEFLLSRPEERSKLKRIFDGFPEKWRKKIKASAKTVSPKLYDFISRGAGGSPSRDPGSG